MPIRQPKGRLYLLRALILVPMILFIGTVGYKLLSPNMGWFESLYMTVITISTVGYGEVTGITPAGRAFTLFLILAGISLVSFVLFAISQAVVEGQLQQFLGRRKLDKAVAKLQDHVILCGYGRIGEIVAEYLQQYGKRFIIIDKDPEAQERLERSKHLFIMGDATEDEILKQAGIERASALIAATSPDANNIYLTLTARELNSKIKILSRAFEKKAEKRLLQAGANKIIYPDRMGGMRLAFSLLRPAMIGFLDVLSQSFEEGEIELEELTIGERCSLKGRSLKDAQIRPSFNLIVLAVRKPDGSTIFNPGGDTVLAAGDALLTIGIRSDLTAFAKKMDALELQI
jgi:voltage-gated potassium channel